MKAIIDREGCISCGMCIAICPEVFRMGEDDKAEAYAEVSSDNKNEAKEAEDGCPVSVILIEE